MVNGAFFMGLCKNVKYTLKTTNKQQENGRISCGVVFVDEAVLKRKREAGWMLQTVYSYGLNLGYF